MLPEKARDFIEKEISEKRKGMHFDSCKWESVMECALQCIDRRIPMNPIDVDWDYGYFECGRCKGLICNTSDNMEDHKYCLLCGQKIDWNNIHSK